MQMNHQGKKTKNDEIRHSLIRSSMIDPIRSFWTSHSSRVNIKTHKQAEAHICIRLLYGSSSSLLLLSDRTKEKKREEEASMIHRCVGAGGRWKEESVEANNSIAVR